jgi:hypothetical protein
MGGLAALAWAHLLGGPTARAAHGAIHGTPAVRMRTGLPRTSKLRAGITSQLVQPQARRVRAISLNALPARCTSYPRTPPLAPAIPYALARARILQSRHPHADVDTTVIAAACPEELSLHSRTLAPADPGARTANASRRTLH